MNISKTKGAQLPFEPTLTVFIANDETEDFSDIIIQYYDTESGERMPVPEWETDTIRIHIGKWLFNRHISLQLTSEWFENEMVGDCKAYPYTLEAANAIMWIKFQLDLL